MISDRANLIKSGGYGLSPDANPGISLVPMEDDLGPDEWHDVGAASDLIDGKPYRGREGERTVLLLRAADHVFAIGNQCTHQGAGLDRGVVKISGSVRTVTCPAHGSTFRLDDGKVMRPPATKPVPVYDVKVEDGRIFVRPRAET